MDNYTSALTFLSAMITPAVLISACASLVLSTSQRLNRVMVRTRDIESKLRHEFNNADQKGLEIDRFPLFCSQLGMAAKRSQVLHAALRWLYFSIGIFIATSIGIAIAPVVGTEWEWVPVLLGVIGTALLLLASILLIEEANIGSRAVNEEMRFLSRQVRRLQKSRR
jgi:hypothetical protein